MSSSHPVTEASSSHPVTQASSSHPAAEAGTAARRDMPLQRGKPSRPLAMRVYRLLVWSVMVFFLLNVLLMIATVAMNSVATRWFGTPLPQGFTLRWYAQAWEDFQLAAVLRVT